MKRMATSHGMGRILVSIALVGAVATGCSGSAARSTPRASTPTSTPTSAPARTKPAVEPRATPLDGTIATPDGRQRSYHVYVPASLPKDRPVSLLVALHGGFGSGKQFETTSGYDGLAEANGFIVVYPDGTEIGGASVLARGRVWNGGRCCGPAVTGHVDDVGFVSMLIDELEQQYDIDSLRVFASGHSNGAIMSYRLACELSDKIVAIGVQAGSLEVDACHPSQPVSLIHIHGTADRNLPIGGGKGTGLSGFDFQPPLDAVHTLVRADGCPKKSATARSRANADVTVETWQPCRVGSAVEFVKVKGATHAWMGHDSPRAGRTLTGAPYADYDSSANIWAFLASHPRR
jgi:Poly(3-hydroxybutyrate) depolymerase